MIEILFYIISALGLGQHAYHVYFHPEYFEEQPVAFTLEDSSFNAITYFLSGDVLQEYLALDDTDFRQQFIEEYWLQNASRYQGRRLSEGFQTRLNYVEKNFGTTHTKGWQTDKGRFYLIYGEPAEISFDQQYHRKLNGSVIPRNTHYEIWRYASPAGLNPVPLEMVKYQSDRMMVVFAYDQKLGLDVQVFSTEIDEQVDIQLYHLKNYRIPPRENVYDDQS